MGNPNRVRGTNAMGNLGRVSRAARVQKNFVTCKGLLDGSLEDREVTGAVWEM